MESQTDAVEEELMRSIQLAASQGPDILTASLRLTEQISTVEPDTEQELLFAILTSEPPTRRPSLESDACDGPEEPRLAADMEDRSRRDSTDSIVASLLQQSLTSPALIQALAELQVSRGTADEMRGLRGRIRVALDEAVASQSLHSVVHQASCAPRPAVDLSCSDLRKQLQELRRFALEMLESIAMLERRLDVNSEEIATDESSHLQHGLELLLGRKQEMANGFAKLENGFNVADDPGSVPMDWSRRSSNISIEDNREGIAGLMRRSIEIQQSHVFAEGLAGVLGKLSPSRRSSLSSTEDEREGPAAFARMSIQMHDRLGLQHLHEHTEGALLKKDFEKAVEDTSAMQQRVDALARRLAAAESRLPDESRTSISRHQTLQQRVQDLEERVREADETCEQQAREFLQLEAERDSARASALEWSKMYAVLQHQTDRLKEAQEANGEVSMASSRNSSRRSSLEHPRRDSTGRIQAVRGASSQESRAARQKKMQELREQMVRLTDFDAKRLPAEDTLPKPGSLVESRKRLTTLRQLFAENAAGLAEEQTAFQMELESMRVPVRRRSTNDSIR